MKISNKARREIAKGFLIGGTFGFVFQIFLGLTLKGFIYIVIVIFAALLIWPEREKNER